MPPPPPPINIYHLSPTISMANQIDISWNFPLAHRACVCPFSLSWCKCTTHTHFFSVRCDLHGPTNLCVSASRRWSQCVHQVRIELSMLSLGVVCCVGVHVFIWLSLHWQPPTHSHCVESAHIDTDSLSISLVLLLMMVLVLVVDKHWRTASRCKASD